MSTLLNDFANTARVVPSVYPVEIDDTDTGASVDMLSADGNCFAIQVIGAVSGSSPLLVGKIEESADGVTWTDVTGGAFAEVDESNNVQIINFQRTKRYLRHSRTVTGLSASFMLSALIGERYKQI